MFIIFLFLLARCGHIYTWDFQYVYNIKGQLQSFTIPIKLENSLSTGYLQLGGVSLHKVQMSEVSATMNFLNGTTIFTSFASLTTQTTFPNDYYFQITQYTPNQVWLYLVISCTYTTSGFYTDPLMLRTLSVIDDNAIIYDFNYAAGNIYIATQPPSGMTVTYSVNSTTYPTFTQPGQSYIMSVFITPRVTLNGVQIQFQIDQGLHTDGIGQDFQFLGDCASLQTVSAPAFQQYNCVVDMDGQRLILDAPNSNLVSNQQYCIQFAVQNPLFGSTRDLLVATVGANQGGFISETGQRTNVFQVSLVDTTTVTVQYLWGIDYLETITGSYVNLFAVQSNTYITPYNPIQVQFTVGASVNLIYSQIVRVHLGCDHALAGTTKHNLPVFDDSGPVQCSYYTNGVSDQGIQCTNVGTLTPQSTYYISTRALYLTNAQIDSFGSVRFKLDSIYTLQIYSDSPGVQKNVDTDSHMLDIGGWHSSTGGLSYTQVSSIPSNLLSSTTLRSVLGPQATVGITPMVGDASLLFFLKTTTAQICGASALASDPCNAANINNKYLKMSILINSRLFTSNQTLLPFGLNYIANDGAGIYQGTNFACYQLGLCDLPGQNYYNIYQGKYQSYGVVTFECGLTSGSASLLSGCLNLQGSGVTMGVNGIFALPYISYPTGFSHSGQYADENVIDFVVTFYRGTIVSGLKPTTWTVISSHLINAYTVSSTKNAKASFINYYLGTSQGNNGQVLPTMLRVQVPTQILYYDRIQVFFDSAISVFSSQSYGCSVDCYSFSGTPGLMDVWYLQQQVMAWGDDDILIPVIPSALPKTIYIVLSSVSTTSTLLTENIIQVYRIYGAALNSESRTSLKAIGGLAAQASNLAFTYNAIKFDFSIDTSTITSGYNTLKYKETKTNQALDQNQGQFIGSGITLVSIGYNLFDNFHLYQYYGEIQCFNTFSYQTYGSVASDVNANQPRFVKFCPFDNQISHPLSAIGKTVLAFGQNFKLSTILAYGISSGQGQLLAAIKDPGTISRILNTCALSNTNTIYPNSLGQQRIIFPIRFSSQIILGGSSYQSLRIVITLAAAINGLSLTSTTSLCTVQTIQTLSCQYTSSSTVITATLTSATQITIQKYQVLNLIFRIVPTYGLAAFGANQAFTVQIQLPSKDSTTSQLAIFGNAYDTPPVIQESCTMTQITLSTTSLQSAFTLSGLKFQVYNQNAYGTVQWIFGLSSQRDYVAASLTYIQFNLGFMKTQSAAKLKCAVYYNGQISTDFAKLDLSALPLLKLYYLQDLENPYLKQYQMQCNNFQTPTNAFQSLAFQAFLIDILGTTIVQQSQLISYDSIGFQPINGVIASQLNAALVYKNLNTPGFGSVYTLQLQNAKLRILYTYLIYITLHEGLNSRVNRLGFVSCQMDSVYCYCEIKNNMIVINACQLIQPLAKFNITIGQIDQPKAILWPVNPIIWIGVDNNNDLTNGLYFQTNFVDVTTDTNQVLPSSIISQIISSSFIRTTQTHSITMLLPSGSVYEGNQLLLQLPSFYVDQLQLAKNYTCNLIRVSDNTLTNFASNCILAAGSLFQMTLIQDSSNNLAQQYILTLGAIPLPSNVPPDPLNNFKARAHIIAKGSTKIQYTSALYNGSNLYLQSETGKQSISWSGAQFQYERKGLLDVIGETAQIVTIYQGVYKSLIQMYPNVSISTTFTQTFGYSLNAAGFKTFPQTLTSQTGSSSSQFLIGAIPSKTIGYYVINFIKSIGGTGYISLLPNLYAFVVNQPCQLSTNLNNINIPQGGYSHYISIDIHNCYPMSDLRIQLVNTNPVLQITSSNPQNIIFQDIESNQLHFQQNNFIFQIQNNDTNVTINSTSILYFILSGNSYSYYAAPANITVMVTDPNPLVPTVNFTKQPQIYKNTANFFLTCTTPAVLLWAIGIGDNIIYIEPEEIKNNTIFNYNLRTLRNISDTSAKIYGTIMVTTANLEYIEQFEGLIQNSNYYMISYCISQYGQASNSTVYNWQTSPNGGANIKLNITFSQPLRLLLQYKLVCAVNLLVAIDPSRIYNEKSYSCDTTTLALIAAQNNVSSRLLYTYNSSYNIPNSSFIYLNSDTSLMTDQLNQIVKTQVQDKNYFSQLATQMDLNPLTDPTIVSVEYSEPDQSVQPTLYNSTPEVSFDSIRINFTFFGCKGYLGVGIEQTDTSANPSTLQVRRSQNYLNATLFQGYLIYFNYSSKVANETKPVVFYGLSPNLKYQIYWFSSNDDAGPFQLVSNVSMLQIQTIVNKTYNFSAILYLIFYFMYI